LGAQGSIPSIVGNDLQFKKLTASDISGVMHNPAIEDLIMGQWDILFSANGNIGMTNGAISGVSTLSSSQNLQISSQTGTLVTGGRFEVQPVLGAEIKLQCSSTGLAGPINIVWPDTSDTNGYNIKIGGNRTSGSCQVNIMNNNYSGSASFLQLGSSTLGSNRVSARQIDIDAGLDGLQMGSDAKVFIDAATNIEIDAGGILDLSGNQIVIDASSMTNGVGVNISAANAITMDAANIDVEATTKLDLSGNDMTLNSTNNLEVNAGATLDLSGNNITINSTNNLEVNAGATLDLSSTNTKLNGTTTLDITGTNINIGTSSSIVDISGQISLNKVANLTATNITADNVFVDALYSNPQNTKITLNDNLDVNQKDISNCNTLRVDSIFQNNVQLIIGNFINGSSKYVKFGNKIALYTTNSVTTANAELNGSLPNNYLIGYDDVSGNSCGGLIYRADIGSGAMNKLITTTSLHRFSTNFFRTLTLPNGTDGTYLRSSPPFNYTSASPSGISKIYRTLFYNTDQLILNPGVKNWWPGSTAYRSAQDPEETGTGIPVLYDPGTIFDMKFLQLSKNQFIRVLNFTFEGYNNSYQINYAFMGTGNTLYFEILFGFGNTRAFETGPYTATNAINFQKCYQVNTEVLTVGGASNAIILKDLSLNTVHYSASPTYPKMQFLHLPQMGLLSTIV
jgi:hypothetical protein